MASGANMLSTLMFVLDDPVRSPRSVRLHSSYIRTLRRQCEGVMTSMQCTFARSLLLARFWCSTISAGHVSAVQTVSKWIKMHAGVWLFEKA